tara:strand:+ start:424 stop:636 length:213 start_codon:yes stop_codon:yes gene_type:complete
MKFCNTCGCNHYLSAEERKALCFSMTYITESLKRGAKGLIAGAENVGVERKALRSLADKFCDSLKGCKDD